MQCPYFTCTLTAYRFGVIIVLHKNGLLKAAQLHKRLPSIFFLQLEHFFKANILTGITILYIKTKSTEMTVIVIRWPDLLSSNSH